MNTLTGYHITEKIYESGSVVIFRGVDHTDRPVVLKKLKDEYLSPQNVAQFRSGFTIARKLAHDGIVTPLAIGYHENTLTIVLEDFGGTSLNNLLSEISLTLRDFLIISAQIAGIIGDIHRGNVIHKDIKPANIILRPSDSDKLWLIKVTDFHIASELSHESITKESQALMQGSLPYISPEQTGRMNRSVDYRTDLYSLGVTMYQMITGELPFTTRDPGELIHCHIARTPVAPHEKNPAIPRVVSDIIMKLLAKNPEERYRSAYGVKNDLEACLASLDESGTVRNFQPGINDVFDRFMLPEKLYGRDRELARLIEEYRLACQGRNRFLLVSGQSGIGKTCLISEFQRNTGGEPNFFVAGKFEHDSTHTPFSALISALHDLITQILTGSNDDIKKWQKKLFEALYPNIKIIIDVIPQLEHITGPQPDVPDLGPTESLNRFNLYFEKFIGIFADINRPLILFLDDLQWADRASLNFIRTAASSENLSGFLFIGSYRDDEVTEDHAFAQLLEEMKKSGKLFTTIELKPLGHDQVCDLISDTLSIKPEKASELSSLILRKTGGNPFFVKEFIRNLYHEKYLQFHGEWKWDTEEISSANITDNVSKLMADRVKKLPDDIRDILTTASCFGEKGKIDHIARMTGASGEQIIESLKPVIGDGMVIKSGGTLRFAHDRIRDTIYSLAGDDEKSTIHFAIGLIMKEEAGDRLDEAIFTIVHHFNLGRTRASSPEARRELARLNCRAGIKAKNTAAFDSAAEYYDRALELAGADRWEMLYDLALEICAGIVETAYYTGNQETAERSFAEIIANARNTLDKIKAYEIKMSHLSSCLQFREALDTGIAALRLLGVRIPSKPGLPSIIAALMISLLRTWLKSPDDIASLPEMKDPRRLAIARILVGCIEPAYLGVPDHLPTIVLKLFNFSLKYGNSPYSAYSYILYSGILMEAFGRIDPVYEFGNLALKVLENVQEHNLSCKVFFIYGVGVRHWKKHISEDLEYLQKSFTEASEKGDLAFASYALHHYMINSFFKGDSLNDLLEKYAQNYEIMKRYNCTNTLQSFEQMYQFILNLSGEAEDRLLIAGSIFDERTMIPEWEATDSMTVLGHYTVCKMALLYLNGKYEESVKIAERGRRYLGSMMGLFFIPEYYYYYSLSLLACDPDSGDNASRKKRLRQTAAHQRKMKKWSRHAPCNFEHKYLLVEAERARVAGKNMDVVLAAYSGAIESARKNGFIHDEALGYERASRFFSAKGFRTIAETYLHDAITAYRKWGARNRVDDLEKEYSLHPKKAPAYGNSKEGPSGSSFLLDTSSRYSTLFDINSIIKSSQSLSREIRLEKILESLMRIAIENAGAQKGVLLLQKGHALFIEAEIYSYRKEVVVLHSIPLAKYCETDGSGLPLSILNYVSRTLDDLVLDNASEEFKFNSDPYIRGNNIKSVLCTPIIYQGSLTGILYLENNITTRAFTPERLNVLKILSSQAAISIEIATIYQGLERLVQERTLIIEEQKKELERQIELAGQIQSALLPREIPQIREMSIAYRYLPMMDIGGDFLDIKHSEEHNGIAFFICDVSGHGVAAALIASMVKMSLANWHYTLNRPSETLTLLYRLLAEKIGRNFITASICYVDFATSKLTYSKAGHLPLIIARTDGSIDILNPRGRVINDIMQPNYQEEETTLKKGDKIVLYTDGIIEAYTPERTLFGEEMLLNMIRLNHQATPDTLCDSILKAVTQFTGLSNSFDDDITILAGEYRGRR